MTQDEIAVMDGGKCILQLRGVRPVSYTHLDVYKRQLQLRAAAHDTLAHVSVAAGDYHL